MTTRNSTPHDDEHVAGPGGELALQTIAMPKDANYHGDIFGGWLLSQMDLAGAVLARRVAKGRVATVAVDSMVFLRPVPVGAVVSCYARMLNVGRSSMQVMVEVWVGDVPTLQQKVTEGKFTFVAIDETGRTRAVEGSGSDGFWEIGAAAAWGGCAPLTRFRSQDASSTPARRALSLPHRRKEQGCAVTSRAWGEALKKQSAPTARFSLSNKAHP